LRRDCFWLIATPVMRVAVSILVFVYENDRIFILITCVVLALLLLSFLLGERRGSDALWCRLPACLPWQRRGGAPPPSAGETPPLQGRWPKKLLFAGPPYCTIVRNVEFATKPRPREEQT